MKRSSFFRLLGKGAAILALAPSILVACTPKKYDGFMSVRYGGRTFHFKRNPFDGENINPLVLDEVGQYQQDIDNVVGKLVKEHGSVDYLHFAGQHEEKMLKKYWKDYEKAMIGDPIAFHDYIDKL